MKLLVCVLFGLVHSSVADLYDFIGDNDLNSDILKEYPEYGGQWMDPAAEEAWYQGALQYLLQNSDTGADTEAANSPTKPADDSSKPAEIRAKPAAGAQHAKPRADESVQQPGVGGPLKHTGGSDKGEDANGQSPKIKTDAALPAYCDPPNPCPVGMKASDGCQESGFSNTAEYVKQYQAQQNCQCDRDHMRCDEQQELGTDTARLLQDLQQEVPPAALLSGLNPSELTLNRAAKKSSDPSDHFLFRLAD